MNFDVDVGCSMTYVLFIFSMNLGIKGLVRSKLTLKKAMSRKFLYVSKVRIKDLKQIRLKPNFTLKVNWGVNTYNEWRQDQLNRFQYDSGIYKADLNNLGTLTKENFSHALCRFIPEAMKQKDHGPYLGHTLY